MEILHPRAEDVRLLVVCDIVLLYIMNRVSVVLVNVGFSIHR